MPNIEEIMRAALVADESTKAQALAVLQGRETKTNAPERLLTLRGLAEASGLSTTTLWRLKVPSISLGGRRRFRLGDCMAYIESPECQARTEELRAARKAGRKTNIK